MKKRLLSLIAIALILFFQGCNVGKHVSGAYKMIQCQYEYQSISNLAFAGIDLSNGVGLTTAPKVLSALTDKSSSLPLDFTVNLDVTNPNQGAALLNGLDYILKIDNIEFTRGAVNQSINIASGDSQILPLAIGLDLATLLSGNSANAVQNIIKNFLGVGNEKSKVTLQIKPSFRIGNKSIPTPQYIPISFSFGGN